MAANAILVVPPFLKIAYGPLLGPAMLVAAGRRAGHSVDVLDLNSHWIRERLVPADFCEPRKYIGDHDRPSRLGALHDAFRNGLANPYATTHDQVAACAMTLVHSTFGNWVRGHLASHETRPDVVGLSVMYRDQVEPALAITIIAWQLFPSAIVIWGGAHVTALQHEIAADPRYGELVDGFVFGYAERTWVSVLDAVVLGTKVPNEVVRAGSGRTPRAISDVSVTPIFDDLSLYSAHRLTLPMQTARGCSYGVCTYCTYPSIEGTTIDVPWDPIDAVIEQAVRLHAPISFKDSLLTGERLELLADRIDGRVSWSACTKLDARLAGRLQKLAKGGCATVEIGLETLERPAQVQILKRQNAATFFRVLDAAAAAGIAIVVNYMTGLPRVDAAAEARCKALVENELAKRGPALVAKLEHNEFQLERLSAMGRDPERFGMRVVRASAWSSVLDWDPIDEVAQLIQLRRSR